MRAAERCALSAVVVATASIALAASAATASAADPAAAGAFGLPFQEPTIDGRTTNATCIPKPGGPTPEGMRFDCKPVAAASNVLPNGKVLYWNNLEGTENFKVSIVLELGTETPNDQSRVLALDGGPSWSVPTPADGGANPNGYKNDPLFPPPLSSTETYNDGEFFCSDQKFLADGRLLDTGGTSYYDDPVLVPGKFGVAELEGLRNTRIYDPVTNTWSQSGDTKIGRWYPTLITLGNGKILAASGVQKLVKPVYIDRPEGSGTNVKQTETYDPVTGKWTDNGTSAQRSLPLFPRLHLLPDGKVFYNAAGQAFNPLGQSYDEAIWNVAAVYNPATKSWRDLGIPGLANGDDLNQRLKDLASADPGNPVGDLGSFGIPGGGRSFTVPGFRGSTFSIMLPLKPDAAGNYTKAQFLTAGGVLNPPSPGSYFPTSDSRITTVDTTRNDAMTTRATGDMSRPHWYSSGLLLPTGEVLATSGADRDEVAAPGVEIPIRRAELFNPATGTWTPVATARQARTYHNTSVLLPDGRVLVGGHAPISALYTTDMTLVPGVTAPQGHDPTFEIYSPPYLFRGPRPVIQSAPDRLGHGGTFQLDVAGDGADIASVVLVRNSSVTHLVDADQRNVELRIVGRDGNHLTVALPPDGNVAPPGPYLLFVNRSTSHGPVPSVSKQVFVGVTALERRAARHRAAAARG